MDQSGRGRRHRWFWGCAALSLAAVIGCRKAEEPQAPETPVAPSSAVSETAAPEETVTEAPSDAAAASLPVTAPEPTPEEREAEETFAAMTAEGVSPEAMEAAIEKLLSLGSSAVPVLTAKLQSDEQLDREMAATLLAQVGPDVAAQAEAALVGALKDESDFVRANVATALAQMDGHGEDVAPVFLAFLSGTDEHLRQMAAMNLAVLEVDVLKPSIDQLANALSADDRQVQIAIAQLLGRIGPDAKPAVDELKAVNTEDDEELQTAVKGALAEIEGETPAEPEDSDAADANPE